MDRKRVMLLVGLSLSFAASPAVAGAASRPAKVTPSQLQQVLDRLDSVEQQNRAIQQENRDLRSQVLELKQQVQPAAAQKASIDQEVKAQVQQQVAPLAQQVNATSAVQRELPYGVGFRVGYSESPYRMPGGLRYSAFLNFRLLTEEDGIPFGDVTGELEAALVQGNGAKTVNNLATILVPPIGPAESWLQTVEIQPTVQYHLNLASLGFPKLAELKPYALAGPGVWISMFSTPVVNKAPGPGQGFRATDADTAARRSFRIRNQIQLVRPLRAADSAHPRQGLSRRRIPIQPARQRMGIQPVHGFCAVRILRSPVIFAANKQRPAYPVS